MGARIFDSDEQSRPVKKAKVQATNADVCEFVYIHIYPRLYTPLSRIHFGL
jgi:hypothetical protein